MRCRPRFCYGSSGAAVLYITAAFPIGKKSMLSRNAMYLNMSACAL